MKYSLYRILLIATISAISQGCSVLHLEFRKPLSEPYSSTATYSTSGKTPDETVLLGIAEINRKNYSKAMEILSTLTPESKLKDFKQCDVARLKGFALMNLGKYQAAADEIKKVTASDAASDDDWVNLALCYSKCRGMTQPALEAISKADRTKVSDKQAYDEVFEKCRKAAGAGR